MQKALQFRKTSGPKNREKVRIHLPQPSLILNQYKFHELAFLGMTASLVSRECPEIPSQVEGRALHGNRISVRGQGTWPFLFETRHTTSD
jgi:hypothetical protein